MECKRFSECLIMIDGLQRLAIDYHFEEEIEAILGRINRSIAESDGVYDDNDLYYVSLRFRLLRQNGYHPSADVFNKFKDEKGTFKLSLREDLRGIMELFEASELRIEGEIILDEASVFASKHLNDELVKVDFNIVQTLHQKELLEVSMWWKDLGLTQELKFARNQPVKWYLWSIAALSDPRYSKERIELTKPISLIYIMDDIFDVHGTFYELVLFTEAINMWDLSAMEKLPHYMKVFYKVIYDITDDISSKVFEEHGCNPSDSLRKAWGKLCDAFLMEAKWFTSGKVPEAEEYLKNGDEKQDGHDGSYINCYLKENRSSTVESARKHVFCMISDAWKRLNKECLSPRPFSSSFVKASLNAARMVMLMYTVESARKHVFSMISDAWKKLNKECLSPRPFSSSFVKASLNAARMVSLMYSYDDNHQLPNLEQQIKSLLYENITL
ncbi:hypothetical protein GIB67_033385 [Kingdonia uniflora]|uniref:Uncharacterized protein n=1 Tax=Kingdonia uniflora TaxID=39325 RepID=A0A7J7LTM2_9MAGN|nr:hypothetical protein GIB67_033385 [Kingdonia uniflora]